MFELSDWSEIPIASIAASIGTPFYIFDASRIRTQVESVRKALPFAELYYAIKANPNLKILSLLRKNNWIDGLDISTLGNIFPRDPPIHPPELAACL